MRSFLRIALLNTVVYLCFPCFINAQSATIAVLQQRLSKLKNNPNYLTDTAYIKTVNELAFLYADSNPNSALQLLNGQAERCHAEGFGELETVTYKILGSAFETKGSYDKALQQYEKAYQLAEKIGYNQALPGILNNIGLVYYNQGNYPAALEKFYATLRLAEALQNKFVAGSTLNNIANIHFFQGKMKEAAADYQRMLDIAAETYDTSSLILAHNNIAEVNLKQHNTLAALSHLNAAASLALRVNDPEMLAATAKTKGYVYLQSDSLPAAITHFKMAVKLSEELGNVTLTCDALKGLAESQQKMGLLTEALATGLKEVQLAQKIGHAQLIKDGSEITASVYEASGDAVNALKYYRLFKKYSDSINNVAGERAAAAYKADYEISKKDLELQRKSLQQRWLTFSALAALLTLTVIVWLVNRNRSKLALTYKDLQQKNLLIEAQKKTAEETLLQLKAAQAQLIQAEKMASLGELTSGIAHEIQNPLNFVNNFSELNIEMIAELQQEISKGNYEEVKAIATDIEVNEGKINHHGKRADAIVKGMLQHSNARQGNKELTDINLLADEYLRLSYHGLRTKDQSINVTVKTDFDNSIGNISIIPQEIGRVLLNILTNAFYAVIEKKTQQGADYEPAVSIGTKKIGNSVEIKISDNGNGIPPSIADKIFQPFFTTKPTGQGTGLGLSLAYDIVKAHGGQIRVETKENEGTTFIIQLPKSF